MQPKQPVRKVSVSQSPVKSAANFTPEDEKATFSLSFFVMLAKYGIPLFAAN